MSEANTHNTLSNQAQDTVDFLIITALPEERDAVLEKLGDCETDPINDSPTYYKSSVLVHPLDINYKVAVTMLKQMGNVEAAQHASQAINELNPAYVLMVGIAGGIKGEVKLGDVVIATQLFYYELAKEKPEGCDRRPQMPPTDSRLLNKAQNYLDTNWHTLITAKRPDSSVDVDSPKVHFGVIAVGEKVIADENRVNELKSMHSKLLAVEMESFGVASACANAANRPRFLAIRGISDYADPEKNDDWHEYAADVAAAFAIGFIRSGSVPLRSAAHGRQQTRRTLIAIRHQSMESIPPKAISKFLPQELEASNIEELVIDQTNLYIDGRLIEPLEAAKLQRELTQRLNEMLNDYPTSEVAYYGIAHIPLAFLAGSQLLRKPLHLFEHNRQTNQWDQLQMGGDYPDIKLEGLPACTDFTSGDVVVRISISYTITPEAIEGIVPTPIASLHLRLEQPTRDIVTSEKQIIEYSKVFCDMLDGIRHKLPNTERVHLFYAGPVTLAFSLGRLIRKTIHPNIIIYNHSSKDVPRYAWGLEVTSNIESPSFLVKTQN